MVKFKIRGKAPDIESVTEFWLTKNKDGRIILKAGSGALEANLLVLDPAGRCIRRCYHVPDNLGFDTTPSSQVTINNIGI